MTPREFYEDDPRWLEGKGAPEDRFGSWLEQQVSPTVQGLLETLIHSDLATEPGETNLAYGLQNYLMNDPAYMRLYAIEGGNEQLTRELARRIAATVRLQQPVRRIGPTSEGRLRVESEGCAARPRAGQPLVEEFDFLVLALPSGALQSIEYDSVSLHESMQLHHQRFHHPAHYLRITLLFSQPFWKNSLQGSFCMLDAFGGCCLYDESARHPESAQGILGWLLGGENAVQQSQLSDEALIAEALDSLPAALQHGRDYLVEGRVHRWTGAVSAWPGGLPSPSLDSRHQPASRTQPNLFVVGDYLFDSTLNGVLDSAQYVADWLAAELHGAHSHFRSNQSHKQGS
jgi:monoamine oxidase